LLVVDLNSYAPRVRPILAESLTTYLRSREARARHDRAVVTYRGHDEDSTLELLRKVTWNVREPSDLDRVFLRVDLEPFRSPAAVAYLKCHLRVKALVAGTNEPSDIELERDSGAIRELIDRFDRGEGPLISIPLLLYFVGLVCVEVLREVPTLARIYDRVVAEFLDREERHSRAEIPQTRRGIAFDRELVMTAMGRLALAILAQGTGSVRLTGPRANPRNINHLFEEPDAVLARYLLNDRPDALDWYWRSSPYIAEPLPPLFDKEASGAWRAGIGERSFLRTVDGEVGFVHDSFLYYFAAFVLRHPRECVPDSFLNEVDVHWRSAVVRWWATDPPRWEETAEFFGGMLEPGEARELARDLVVARSRAGWPTLIDRVVRNHIPALDPVLDAIDAALHHKEGMLARCPQALFAEIYHYLRDGSGDEAARTEAEALSTRHVEPWLRVDEARSPAQWTDESLHAHRSGVTLVTLLDDGRVVSGDKSGEVILWDPRRRTWRTLYRHDSQITAIAVSRDGRVVVSGGVDGAVRRTVDGRADDEPLYKHGGAVYSVAVSDDGRVIVGSCKDLVRRAVDGRVDARSLSYHDNVTKLAVSGDGRIVACGCSDGRVFRAVDGRLERGPLYKHMETVTSVAVSRDGRVIVSGAIGGDVRRAVDGCADREPIYRHHGWVSSVAVSGDGRVVVSGGVFDVCRAIDGRADPGPLLELDQPVRSVAVSRDGRIVACGGDDLVVRRFIDDRAGNRSGYRRDPTPTLTSVAINDDGRVVVGGYDDGTVRRVIGDVGDPEPLYHHGGRNISVAVSGGGRVIISGGGGGIHGDGTVRRAVHGRPEPGRLYAHSGSHVLVAVSEDGRIVVSGGGGGGIRSTVRRSVNGSIDLRPLYEPSSTVNSIAISADGRVVVTGDNGGEVCRARTVHRGDPATLYEHRGPVSSVAVSADGRVVVSGGYDCTVRRAVDGRADDEPLYEHGQKVRSVAISGDGRVVASGGDDHILRLHLDGRGVVAGLSGIGAVEYVVMARKAPVVVAVLGNGQVLHIRIENLPAGYFAATNQK
jgi:WD40 repeat protein